jgi:hypothetical protein
VKNLDFIRKKALTKCVRLDIIYGRSKDSRWPMAVNPAEDINMFHHDMFMPLCAFAPRGFLFGRDKPTVWR